MDRILRDPGDDAGYFFPRQPLADGIRYPWALNNIFEQLIDVVGRAHRADRQLDVHANGLRYRYHNGATKGGVSLK
jgi:hypothetical protein